ncbi:hypothetical protein FBY04_13332 [Pseudomonas sp. SJZ080]|uniref:hypothetical protein n=1 Tax=Pseudomonas sp. SJZ080 TaxID=2572888 RepID=UPI0011993F1E|nr:hypothetical protein [Pseudomonas sp. SJZ080]TWC46130.1 hypothetical protein FBY04_13332 [Pseudomonas sp. SJZ080]
MLTHDQLEKIERTFSARALITPIRVKNPFVQQAATPQQIFELQRISSDFYYFIPTARGNTSRPAVDGIFAFVILASDPGRIYCGALSRLNLAASENTIDPCFIIDGHTSLSNREDILFAGELFFKSNKLKSWNNGSGHYRPDAQRRYTNLIPAIQRLLPEDRFHDYFNMAPDQVQMRLVARGYTLIGNFGSAS